VGFDQTTAEVLVSLITGAITPDTGDVTVFGNSTRDIVDGDAWLQGLDRFGILSDRAVLLDQLTAEQNLAVPFSLDIHEMSDVLRLQVGRLADEVGLRADERRLAVASLGATARQRIRLGRALALNPAVLLAEHPNASLDATDVPQFGADLSRVVTERRLTSLIITADRTFARLVSPRVLELDPASGALRASAGWRSWFS
jgi:ABC-type transporter Mla maintaining outer membrane lipid asymmetry ATPase subunit MlaF